ncbi:MAG: hypothetical protein ACRDLT_16385 [Solirubrobacteraceae bacterium]
MPSIDADVVAFYTGRFSEDARLRLRAHGILERVRTQELIARFLPPSPAVVLDVGGGTGVHAGISRYATLMDIGSDGRLTEDVEPFVRRLHESGEFRGDAIGFSTAYFHMPAELLQEVIDADLNDAKVFGIEGPAGPTLRALGTVCLEQRLEAAVRAARIVERDPQMLAASGHLLAVGRSTVDAA